jgi:tetratricopeptide (TPR) repeat protein
LSSICAAALFVAAPAHASWYKASSKHFVIYADESPKALSEFATRLERFDEAVRYVRGMDDPPVGDGNRLMVFVMPDVGTIQRLAGDRFVDGFYTGRVSGSLAFVPRKSAFADPGTLDSDIIFFHEYSHHLMFQVQSRPLPEWLVEGFAEFMSTVRFEKNGDIGIGAPANHRAWGLLEGQRLPLETMLSGNYTRINDEQRESIYGRGWLLVHYMTFEKSRAGQLDRYADLLGKGVPSLDAARQAFGDLKQLDRDLDQYLHRSMLTYLRLDGRRFVAPPISVEPLSDGASKVILLRAQSEKGVDEKSAEPLAAQVRPIEARYPGDELVELTLSEAELDAGHPDASEAAADRALKANPKNTDAIVLKARAIEASAEKLTGDDRTKAFDSARKLFISANKIDTEDPEPLYEFYWSYLHQGIRPTDNAIDALHYASDLAPQDEGVRMNSAIAYLNEGKLDEAKTTLTVVAYSPHGGETADLAKRMMTDIIAGNAKAALAEAERGVSEKVGSR